MGFGSNFRCRGATGAYGPHGLVRNQNTGELFRGQRAGAAGELAAEDCFGQAGVALFLGFSQANDGGETAGKSHQGLLGDVVIGLAKKLAALGVADDDVAAADLGKHRSGDLAGEGDAGAFCGFDGGRERGEGRGNGNVAMFCVRNKREEGGEKRAGFRERFVHFPIADDYAASHVKTSGKTKDLNTEDTEDAESTEKKAVICWSGPRRQGVCVPREIRAMRRHPSRCVRFCPQRRIDGPRQPSRLHQRWRSRRCWWLRRRLWPLPACLLRMRAFRIRPWGRSRRWSWPQRSSADTSRWSSDRCPIPSIRPEWPKPKPSVLRYPP